MNVQIIRSKRKTVSICVKPDATVVVRAPYRLSVMEIDRILESRKDWIGKQMQELRQKEEQKSRLPKITGKEQAALTEKARAYLPERVEYFARLVGVDYQRITIRRQKSRWGSCSTKGNLNFNCLLMLTPPEVIDYVVVHELCHRKEMNHSAAFWKEVGRVLPDYKILRKWLKEQGDILIERMEDA